MERLVQTSRGWAVVELDRDRFRGTLVSVTRFAADGWETDSKAWTDRYGHHSREEPLQEILATALEIPEDEAESLGRAIEQEWFAEWEARGGAEVARSLERGTALLLTAVVVSVVLAAVGIVALVWLVFVVL